MLGIPEWPGNETRTRPKLCWEYQSGLGMRLGPSYVGNTRVAVGPSYVGNTRVAWE